MRRLFAVALLLLSSMLCFTARAQVRVGAECMESYLPLLDGERVGLLANHTSLVGETHLVDTLLSEGIDLRVIFAPEHGFRGTADAGEHVDSNRDAKTGLPVVSLYGSHKKPTAEELSQVDVVLFDLQDVGLRFYTYLSSMHYLMEACAEQGKELIVLDRPNPNGFVVDGPVLEPHNRSFVGMHPIPVFHGMSLGELAQMINGEGWLAGGVTCSLVVIPCEGYTHQTRYTLPVAPSPNLPNQRSIYLYGSLCLFEGTPVSLGRGTDAPFQIYGHPNLQGAYSFTPRSGAGAKYPPQQDKLCRGVDLRTSPADSLIWSGGLDLSYLIDAYTQLALGEKFFTPFFSKLIGADYVKEMILSGYNAQQIKTYWFEEVEHFLVRRKPYLIYEE